MTLTVFFAVLGAAFLHALWNALIKTGGSKIAGMIIMTAVQGTMGFLIAMTYDWPTQEVWVWLVFSGLLHGAYKLFLAFAYEQGDLSRVYPIARGAAPMIVTLISAFVLTDAITAFEFLGVFVLGAGIAVMARGAFSSGESRRLVPLALGSALMTAGYTIVDGLGARVAGDAGMFVAWMFALDAMVFVPVAALLRGRSAFTLERKQWGLGALAAFASYGAYAIAVWAMTQAPIALVAALRETSILFAVLLGWLVFKDRMDMGKAIAAGLIVSGVVMTRV